ncbi:MAG: polyribonucleotide nucleotidyltransferase [Rickettsiales bacterium]|jgi:polyribonucleotide nucleotidyltransferase|nr:polyribonucleotide nucleotidyltransferase [Rickettsiales bacterium]
MFNIIKKEIEWGGSKLSLETGHIGRQASSVIVRYNDITVMCNITVAKKETTGIDFVPLTVSYIEKFYAGGKIPGGFIKRETKPSDVEVLIARTIDRTIRPLFPSNYRNETNIFCTLLSYSKNSCIDVVAMIGASAAIAISQIPIHLEDTIAGAKVRYRNGKYEINTYAPFEQDGKLDLLVAGTKDSILMVESEAKELNEDEMLNALDFGHKEISKVIDFIRLFANEVGFEKNKIEEVRLDELENNIKELVKQELEDAFRIVKKQERETKLKEISDKVREKFVGDSVDEILSNQVDSVLKRIEKDIVRTMILKDGKRIDGRKVDEVRPISCEIDILPIVHGSALFTRGETQALVVTTLGGEIDEQEVDVISEPIKSHRFLLHYNFPPYATGETGRLGSPGRREIGHGNLARKALVNVIEMDKHEYTVRCVSEICESNGSSSMATVCGTSLALMSSGIPMKAHVSGIAMGLIKEKDSFIVLTDIMGDEDHLGDMDFKVAGTDEGITALQMDIKCKGVSREIMTKALEQAKVGRIHILKEMTKTIGKSRDSVNPSAPSILKIKINPDKIREVIGKQGVVIKDIIAKTDTVIDITDDGIIKILSNDKEKQTQARKLIEAIVGTELKENEIYKGKVVKIIPAGAFVNIEGTDGFLHISQIADYKINDIRDIIREGDIIKVKYLGIDKRSNKPKLGYKDVN